MESELNAELKRLQNKYKAGFDISRVIWEPTDPQLRPNTEGIQNGKGNGQRISDPSNISRWIIIVYEDEDIDQAIHTVNHEFLEHLIMKPAHPFVELSNVLIKLLNRLQYETQEDAVETLAKLEDEESRKNRRNKI